MDTVTGRASRPSHASDGHSADDSWFPAFDESGGSDEDSMLIPWVDDEEWPPQWGARLGSASPRARHWPCIGGCDQGGTNEPADRLRGEGS